MSTVTTPARSRSASHHLARWALMGTLLIGAAFPEDEWVGAVLRIGGALMRVVLAQRLALG